MKFDSAFGQFLLTFMCRLHKAVSNPHLVKLYSYFEDPNFVYIVLELCRFLIILTLLNMLRGKQIYCATIEGLPTTFIYTRKRSLMELHKRRKAITEPESRYFVHQVC